MVKKYENSDMLEKIYVLEKELKIKVDGTGRRYLDNHSKFPDPARLGH